MPISYGRDSKGCCPICGVPVNELGAGEHDQVKHDRRKAEDWPAPKAEGDAPEIPRPGLYNPPGDPAIPPYVRALIERRPDLEAEIMAQFRAGLAGERLEAPDQPKLPIPQEPELQRPRRVFGYGDDE